MSPIACSCRAFSINAFAVAKQTNYAAHISLQGVHLARISEAKSAVAREGASAPKVGNQPEQRCSHTQSTIGIALELHCDCVGFALELSWSCCCNEFDLRCNCMCMAKGDDYTAFGGGMSNLFIAPQHEHPRSPNRRRAMRG
eukprot:9479589-Pyramimonas_sp.AAC.1